MPTDDPRLQRNTEALQRARQLNQTLQDRLLLAEARLAVAVFERDAIRNSSTWRLTAPLRRLIGGLRGKHRPPPPGPQRGSDGTAYQRRVALHDTLDEHDRAAIRRHVAELPSTLISVVMPAYNTPAPLLRAAIASVQGQLYPHWQLCIADDASTEPHLADILAQAAADPRIVHTRLPANGNIAAATNAALALAQGDFVALMDHDDLLPEHALYEVAVELQACPDADLIYSDEDQIDAEGRRTRPYFKPDFDPDLMLGHNLVSHLGVYRRALVQSLGGLRPGFDGSQDYDLALRVIDATTPARIRHIPLVLYHWRQASTSFSKEKLDTCIAAARAAIADHLHRTGQAACTTVTEAPAVPSWTRVQYRLPQPAPKVSVIVPTRDRPALLQRCAHGLLNQTDYPEIELIIVDNDSAEPQTAALLATLRQDRRVRVLQAPGPFNYAAMNNHAAAQATGGFLALLNNDVEMVQSGWLSEMVSQANRPEIGAVGARLLYPDGTVQHVGVVLGVGTHDGGPGVAGHYSLADARDSLGYFGASMLVREVAAVTAACMVLRRELWNEVGGMDADNLPVAFNDVDLCLRIRAHGYRNLFTPHAELIHHESASRGDDLAPEHRDRFHRECQFMRARWGRELDSDPFYNPNFSRMDGLYQLLGPSRRRRSWE